MNRRDCMKSTLKSALALLSTKLTTGSPTSQAQSPIAPGDTRIFQPIFDLNFADDRGIAQWWLPELVLLGNTDRHYASFRPSQWQRDGKDWTYRYENEDGALSLTATVERIDQGWIASLTVGNQSDETWRNVVTPVCLLLRASEVFQDSTWKRTFYRSDGQFLTFHGRETDGGRPIYRMSLVKGQEQIERTERHQKKWGFTKRPSDEGIIGVISDDQSTVLTTTWNPTHHLQANQKRTFSCIHANPFFGSLQPGETRTRRGCVLLTPGDLSQAWDATKKVSEQL